MYTVTVAEASINKWHSCQGLSIFLPGSVQHLVKAQGCRDFSVMSPLTAPRDNCQKSLPTTFFISLWYVSVGNSVLAAGILQTTLSTQALQDYYSLCAAFSCFLAWKKDVSKMVSNRVPLSCCLVLNFA